MTNTITKIQDWLAETLNESEWMKLHHVESIAENRLDVDTAIDRALGEVGICITVLTPVCNYMGDSGGIPRVELSDIVLSVAESPTNREQPDAATALDTAIHAAAIIHSNEIQLKSIVQTADEARGLVICNATFATTIQAALIEEE